MVLGQTRIQDGESTKEKVSYSYLGVEELRKGFIEQGLLELSLLVFPNTHFLCVPKAKSDSRTRPQQSLASVQLLSKVTPVPRKGGKPTDYAEGFLNYR